MSRTISGNNGAITLDPATDNPTYVTGKISDNGAVALYAPAGANWTITNTGSIVENSSYGFGVDVASNNGRFINGTSTGANGYVRADASGVVFTNGTGTVTNFGTIKSTGSYGYGVDMVHGGYVTNGSTSDTNALIAATNPTYNTGVRIDNGGTVRNFGTISGGSGSINGNYGVFFTVAAAPSSTEPAAAPPR
jgi:hypothetical protein